MADMSAYEERSPKPLTARRSRVFGEDVGGEQGRVGCVPTRLNDEAFGHRLEDGSVSVGKILRVSGSDLLHLLPTPRVLGETGRGDVDVTLLGARLRVGVEELEELLGVLGRLGVVERLGDEVS